MEPGYETIVDPTTIVFTLTAMAIHGLTAALQAALVVFLLGTGAVAWLAPQYDTPWLRRLGGMPPGRTPRTAIARVALGVALLLPLVAGASFGFSLAASLAVLALLVSSERGLPADAIGTGRWARRIAIGSTALLATFTVWEGEDPLALGVEVSATAQGWRIHELEWQLANDVEAPKVGELAPDFALEDPSGEIAVRLSDFRGKRPVALVFGSYT